MLYRKTPKTGDELSILRFGCMRLPMRKDGTIGVRIPGCFELYNSMHIFKKEAVTRRMDAVLLSGELTGKPGYASQCVQCGECLEKCPEGWGVIRSKPERKDCRGIAQRHKISLGEVSFEIGKQRKS